MSDDLDQSVTLNFEERHWRRLGPRLMGDFRVVAVCAKALALLGSSPGRTLDLGCGVGPFTRYARLRGLDVIGLDNSPYQIDQAGRIFYEIEDMRERLRCGDVRDLVEAGETFHSIVLLDVLEHVEDRIGFLRLVRKLLDADGQLVLCVPANPQFYDERDRLSGHFLRYDPSTLASEAERAGFAARAIAYWNLLGWLHRKGSAMVSVNTKAENGRFEDYEFRYGDGLFARSTNWFLRNYFLLLENHLRSPAGMSLFAVLVRQE
jgi:2-polyprenyl-3-methyl-5-hydroxy-6-metoxy-1,4-benzoquinol methylase